MQDPTNSVVISCRLFMTTGDYYWYVVANTGNGNSDSSPKRYLAIQIQWNSLPLAPTLTTQANLGTGLNYSVHNLLPYSNQTILVPTLLASRCLNGILLMSSAAPFTNVLKAMGGV